MEFLLKNKNVTINELTIYDIDEIKTIEKKCYTQPWTEDHFLYEVSNPYSHSFVLKNIKMKLCAYIITHKIIDQLFVLNVAVNTCDQGSGYGNY